MNSKRSDTGVGSGLRAGKLWKLPRYGNLWKNKKHFPTGSHSAWKTLRKKRADSFPQFPQLRRLYVSRKMRSCEWLRYPAVYVWSGSRPRAQAGGGAGCQEKKPADGRGRSLFLTSPFIEPCKLSSVRGTPESFGLQSAADKVQLLSHSL